MNKLRSLALGLLLALPVVALLTYELCLLAVWARYPSLSYRVVRRAWLQYLKDALNGKHDTDNYRNESDTQLDVWFFDAVRTVTSRK